MYRKYFKRVFDFVIALIGLILLSPLVGLTAAIVCINDGFPIIFKQQRVGRFGKSFSIYKFRTMAVDSVSHQGSFDTGNVSRVTKTGKFLRKYKLDELPQLYNVIRGDMSLVGPRPEIRSLTEIYPEQWKLVHTVKPGITDWASIEYRNEEAFLANSDDPQETYRNVVLPRKLAYYQEYVSSIKFKSDVEILFKTISSVVTN